VIYIDNDNSTNSASANIFYLFSGFGPIDPKKPFTRDPSILQSSAEPSIECLIASEEFASKGYYMKIKVEATGSQPSRFTRNFFDSRPGGEVFPRPFPDDPFLQSVSIF
jgi:hypothetical protein